MQAGHQKGHLELPHSSLLGIKRFPGWGLPFKTGRSQNKGIDMPRAINDSAERKVREPQVLKGIFICRARQQAGCERVQQMPGQLGCKERCLRHSRKEVGDMVSSFSLGSNCPQNYSLQMLNQYHTSFSEKELGPKQS